MASTRIKRVEGEEDEISKWIRIDEHELVKEWVKHSGRMFKLCLKLADARAVNVECKAEMDLVYAQMSDKVRSSPKDFGILKERVTEEAVKQAIIDTKSYQNAIENYNASKYNVDFWQATVTSFEHRKTALENIVKLRGQNYFSDPVVPKETEEDRKAIRDKADRNALTLKKLKKRKDDD